MLSYLTTIVTRCYKHFFFVFFLNLYCLQPQWLLVIGLWWQIKNAKNAYVKALEYNKNHAKALQQLGWLHYKDEDDFRSAIEYLKRASEIGRTSAPQSRLFWYFAFVSVSLSILSVSCFGCVSCLCGALCLRLYLFVLPCAEVVIKVD